jgi:HSP20 family protein
MYLTTLDPISRDFDRIVRRAFGSTGFAPGYAAALPMDTIRRAGELVLRFDVPGVDPAQIDVTVDKGVLTVSAKREAEHTEGENPVVRERLFGSFTRRVRLSDALDADAITASHRDGVLELRIPVREAARPRKITVGTAPVTAGPAEAGAPAVAEQAVSEQAVSEQAVSEPAGATEQPEAGDHPAA